MTMPWPAVTVADMIESLSQLPADAPLYLIEVQQEWLYGGGPAVTTLTPWRGTRGSADSSRRRGWRR